MSETIRQNLMEAQQVLNDFIAEASNIERIEAAASAIVNAFNNGGKVMSCGNGGSMCDAMHFAEELSGRFRENRKALPAISMADPSHISCVGNDYGYNEVFSRYIEALGNRGDVLLAISTSGNSLNIINAIIAAKSKGLFVIGLTGKDGGKMSEEVDLEIRAPFSKYADRAQEIHIKVIHSIIHRIEELLINE